LILETSPFLENLNKYCRPRRGCGKITICGELEGREDVTAEQGERLVPKTDLLHRIGPANAKAVGNGAIAGKEDRDGGSLEITMDSILQDLLFQDGASRAVQGQP
jgi:hypothetical protein